MTKNEILELFLIMLIIVLTINVMSFNTIMTKESFVNNENKQTMKYSQIYSGTNSKTLFNTVQNTDQMMEGLNDYIGSRMTNVENRIMSTTHVNQGEIPWTIIVYMDADNDLSENALDDLNEMECIGSIPGVLNVIAFADFLDDLAKIYYIDKDDNSTIVTSTELTDTGLPTEPNMGNPANLATFIDYSIENFPADNYFLIFWNHGGGFRGFGNDNSHNDSLTLSEIASVISTRNVDIVGFDACLMGIIEVAHEFKDNVNVFVGSEGIDPMDGWPYDIFFQNLMVNPTPTPNELATQLISDYITSYMVNGSASTGPKSYVTLSALNCSRIDRITTVVSDFALMLNNDVHTYYSEISLARAHSETFPFNGTYIDIYSFAQEIYSQISNVSIEAAAQDVMDEVSAAIIGEPGYLADHPDAHGLAIHFGSYEISNSFITTTAWDEFLSDFLELGNSHSFAIPINKTGNYCGYLNGTEDGVFYSLHLAENVTLNASYMSLTDYRGNFDMYLYSQDLTILTTAKLGGELITYDLVDGQTYYLKVGCEFGHGVFDLHVSIELTTVNQPTTSTTASPSLSFVLGVLSLFFWLQKGRK